MPIVEWSDSFLIGVEMFDEHHKHLVYLLNRSYDEFVSGAPATASSAMLDELFNYAQYHFDAEELWMRKLSYPGREQHVWEHTIFARQLEKIRRDYEEKKTATPLEIMTFLKEWLASHILKSDADMGYFIASGKVTVC
jgi:hemerythrin